MKKGKKLIAMLLALLLLAAPLIALAEEEEKTKREQWRREAIESGYYVKDEYALQVNSLPGLPEDTLSLIQKALDVIRFEVTTFDDIDAVYTNYTLRVSGQEIASVDVRTTETEQWFKTSLVPGQVFTAAYGEDTPYGLLIPISPFSLFTFYLPNLPGGILTLSKDDAAYLDAGLASYLYAVGSWVSVTQYETEDLYVYGAEQLPETETRDAVEQTFEMTLRAWDLKVVMRLMADTFYDDNRLQEVLTRYLSYFGVTREDMRKFADEWPLAVAGLKHDEDAALHYKLYYNEQRDIVGMELDVPKLYEQLPFEQLNATYAAKREEAGLRGTGEGVVLLDTEGSKIVADFALWSGDLVEDTRSESYSIEAKQTMASGAEVDMRTYYEMNQRIEDHVETIDYRHNSSQVGNAQAGAQAGQQGTDLSGTVTTTRLSEDGHFKGEQEYLAVLTGDGTDGINTELALTVTTTTGDYTVPDFSGEQTEMITAQWTHLDALRDQAVANGQSALLKAASLLPPEVLQAIGSNLGGFPIQ